MLLAALGAIPSAARLPAQTKVVDPDGTTTPVEVTLESWPQTTTTSITLG